MYFVIEIQNDAYLVTTKSSRNEAEAEYHRVLSAAAVSDVSIHACSVLDSTGQQILGQCYRHGDSIVNDNGVMHTNLNTY